MPASGVRREKAALFQWVQDAMGRAARKLYPSSLCEPIEGTPHAVSE
jgi:hypothetical protein